MYDFQNAIWPPKYALFDSGFFEDMWNGLQIDPHVCFLIGRLETNLNKSWNFWFLKCFFWVLTPIFQPQRAANFMKTYIELVWVLDDLQPESWLSALRSRLQNC